MALKNNPGFIASSAIHGSALVFLLVNFSTAPKFEDAQETVAVEMVTASELNQIMKGEKTAKPLPKPARRVDKLSDVEDIKPSPPLAEAKRDVPLPPSPDKPQQDPGEDDKPTPVPPQRVAALPPPTPAPQPTPPQRPPEAVATPTPPQRPAPEPPKTAEEKPPPEDAEPLEPKPIPRPKVEPKKEAKTEPAPVPKPVPKPVVKLPEKKVPPKEVKAPEPPKKPEPHLKLEELAKLLKDTKDPPKPANQPKAGNEAKEPPHRDFDPHSISALLDREAPQRKASTGRQLTQMASLGAPNAHAATLSPSMMAQLDQILIDQYHGCWSYFGLGAAQKYVPEVRVHLAQDGSLVGQPALLNPPTDPNLRSLADSAMRAVQKCNPMKIPERFTPYYDAWAKRVVRFNPADMM